MSTLDATLGRPGSFPAPFSVALAEEICGGLSRPEKMPGLSISLPAAACKRGAKLRGLSGTVCSRCYAHQFRYLWKAIRQALARRLRALRHPRWAEAVALLINRQEKSGAFRWHDAGDIQSLAHLERIVAVCRATPHVRHWLPTHEVGILGAFVRKHGPFTHSIPSNLCIRISSDFIDEPVPRSLATALGLPTSEVRSDGSHSCPAKRQGNSCGSCRACWDRAVPITSYPLH